MNQDYHGFDEQDDDRAYNAWQEDIEDRKGDKMNRERNDSMADHETTRYIGLADDKGMEYFHPEADASDGASPWGFSLLNMRASLNRHRNATAFTADLYAFEAEEINNDIKKGNFHAAVGTLKDALAARAGSVLLARGTSKYWDAVHGTTVTLSPGDIAPPDRADGEDAKADKADKAEHDSHLTRWAEALKATKADKAAKAAKAEALKAAKPDNNIDIQ